MSRSFRSSKALLTLADKGSGEKLAWCGSDAIDWLKGHARGPSGVVSTAPRPIVEKASMHAADSVLEVSGYIDDS